MTLSKCKQYLDLQGTENDTLITDLLANAKQWTESYLGKYLTATTVTKVYEFKTATNMITELPVNSVSSVKYASSLAVAFSTVTYSLVEMNGNKFIHFDNFNPGYYEITMSIGYSSVPAGLEQIIIELVAMMYYEVKKDRVGLNSATGNELGMSGGNFKNIYESSKDKLSLYRYIVC